MNSSLDAFVHQHVRGLSFSRAYHNGKQIHDGLLARAKVKGERLK